MRGRQNDVDAGAHAPAARTDREVAREAGRRLGARRSPSLREAGDISRGEVHEAGEARAALVRGKAGGGTCAAVRDAAPCPAGASVCGVAADAMGVHVGAMVV